MPSCKAAQLGTGNANFSDKSPSRQPRVEGETVSPVMISWSVHVDAGRFLVMLQHSDDTHPKRETQPGSDLCPHGDLCPEGDLCPHDDLCPGGDLCPHGDLWPDSVLCPHGDLCPDGELV